MHGREKVPMPMPYSVLLLYPDYSGDGPETFYEFTWAETPEDAAAAVRAVASHVNGGAERFPPEDFAVLGVWCGHHPLERGILDDL